MSEELDARAHKNPVEVTYSAADIAAMNLVLWKFWLGLIAVIAAAVIALPIIFALIDGYPFVDAIAMINWAFTGLVILILAIWLILATALKYWWSGRKGLLGPIQFGLKQEGVSFRSRQMEGVAFWKTIKAVKSVGNRAYLFISRRTAFIVSLRAFDGNAEFDAFVSEAKERWQASERS